MTYPSNQFKAELSTELDNILDYWRKFSVDEKYGGFVGQRDHYNKEVPNASKGIILNTRILWSFSAAGNFLRKEDLYPFSDRAFDYLKAQFADKEYGGMYWEVDYKGNPINKRKQLYAQAFAIYALSEYYLLSHKGEAKKWALTLFTLIEEHARDRRDNGYFEAFQEDWTPIADMRLSEKDKNSSKTMNTHLHILEAYTTLLNITQDRNVEEALENLVVLFLEKFYEEKNQHFQLFFDEHWHPEGETVSYGHDIEAVWLLIEAAKALANKELQEKTNKIAVEVAETFLKEAYIFKGGVINEKNMKSGEVDTDRHWWPQVEAMLGLHYAFKISGNPKYKEAVIDIWDFTKEHIIDSENGEWFFRIDENNNPYTKEDKLGMWKCPYHNSRALIILLTQYS